MTDGDQSNYLFHIKEVMCYDRRQKRGEILPASSEGGGPVEGTFLGGSGGGAEEKKTEQ